MAHREISIHDQRITYRTAGSGPVLGCGLDQLSGQRFDLIINGTSDRFAKPHDTRILVDKLHEQKGITITHQEMEGAGHFFEDPHMEPMIQSVQAYVKRRLTETTR